MLYNLKAGRDLYRAVHAMTGASFSHQEDLFELNKIASVSVLTYLYFIPVYAIDYKD